MGYRLKGKRIYEPDEIELHVSLFVFRSYERAVKSQTGAEMLGKHV